MRDIDGPAGVEALSRLSEIEVQALVDLLLVEHPQLAQEPGGIQVAARVLVERLQRGLDLLARLRDRLPFSLFEAVLVIST